MKNDVYQNILSGIVTFLSNNHDIATYCLEINGTILAQPGKQAKYIAEQMDAYNWIRDNDVSIHDFIHIVQDALSEYRELSR